MTQQSSSYTTKHAAPLHVILSRKDSAVIDELYLFIQTLEADSQQTLELLKSIQSGEVKPQQLKVSDNGFEILPPAPPEAEVEHDAHTGSDNGATAKSKAKRPVAAN